MRVGYIRTSTGKQLCDRQLLALEAQCDRVFIEAGVSATRRKRPVYEDMVAQLKSGDVLVVRPLTGLSGRSLMRWWSWKS